LKFCTAIERPARARAAGSTGWPPTIKPIPRAARAGARRGVPPAVVLALVIFAALGGVLSLAYYAPIVNAVYRKEPSEVVVRGQPVPLGMLLPIAALGVAVIVIGVWPSLLQGLTAPAGQALITAFGG